MTSDHLQMGVEPTLEAQHSCGVTSVTVQSYRELLHTLLLQVCMLFVNLVRFLYLSRWVGVGHWTEMFLLQTAAVALPLLPVVFPTAWLILDSVGMARIQALIHMSSHSQVRRRIYC